MKNILILLILIVGCKNIPAYDCKNILYELEKKPCLLRLNNDGDIITLCPSESGYPKDIVGITIKDYNCNRNYAEKLIKSCSKWKKN